MELFRTQARLQQDCGHPEPHFPGTAALLITKINLRLAAVRRLACEAADCGLLSAGLAAGNSRVKGAKPLGTLLAIGSLRSKASTSYGRQTAEAIAARAATHEPFLSRVGLELGLTPG